MVDEIAKIKGSSEKRYSPFSKENMREIREVREKLEHLRDHMGIKAYEAGDFDEEDYYQDQADVLAEAVEYLWMYEDLQD